MIVYGLAAMFSVDEIYDNFTKILNDDRFEVVFDNGVIYTSKSLDVFLEALKNIQQQRHYTYGSWLNLGLVITGTKLTMPKLQSINPHFYESQPFISLMLEPEFSKYIGTDKDLIFWIDLHNHKHPFTVDNHLSSLMLEAFFEIMPPIYAWYAGYEFLDDILPEGYAHISLEKVSERVAKNYEMQSRTMQAPWRVCRDTMIFASGLIRDLGLDKINWEAEDIFYHKWVTPELLWISSPRGFKSIKLEEDASDYFHGYEDEHIRHIETMERLLDCLWW